MQLFRSTPLVSLFASSLFASSFAFCALVGCGGSDSDGGATVTQMVSQATGGEVRIGSSGAALSIPASSLSGDTEITAVSAAPMAGLPSASTLRGLYYNFGPDGTTFNPPATLTLPAGGTPPVGSTPVVSWFNGTGWTDLATTVAGGMVSAPVEHFTGFVVRWVVTGVAGAVDCSAPKGACGGDIVGTWQPTGACVTSGTVGNCPDSAITYSVALMGSASFNTNMTYAVNLPYSVNGTVQVTPSCLAQTGIASCAAGQAMLRGSTDDHFPTLWANAVCTGSTSTGCECTASTTGAITSNETGTYTVANNAFTTIKTGSTEGTATPYCIDGNTIWVQTEVDPPEYLVFTK